MTEMLLLYVAALDANWIDLILIIYLLDSPFLPQFSRKTTINVHILFKKFLSNQ